jgi:hypothetical protein
LSNFSTISDYTGPVKPRFKFTDIFMKKATGFIFIILSIVLLNSCKKEVSALPQETQTGANTFGATVNGVFWAPQGFGPFPADNLLETRRLGHDIMINARNFASSPKESEFEIYLQDVNATGVYNLNVNTTLGAFNGNYGYFVKRNVSPLNEWITSSSSTGSVTITRIDTVAKIVSGNFHFNAMNLYNAPEPLTVTEGRFDLKFTN